MKRRFLTLFAKHALIITLLPSCTTDSDERTQIDSQQLDLLETPKAGATVLFNENGNILTTTVSDVSRMTHQTQMLKGGMFGGERKYHNETGRAYYETSDAKTRISLHVTSQDPYRPTTYPARQDVTVHYYPDDSDSKYTIEFSNTLASKTIHGVTYTDVVLGIDNYRQDTLYWKKGLGILGWKRKSDNYTAYRVF